MTSTPSTVTMVSSPATPICSRWNSSFSPIFSKSSSNATSNTVTTILNSRFAWRVLSLRTTSCPCWRDRRNSSILLLFRFLAIFSALREGRFGPAGSRSH